MKDKRIAPPNPTVGLCTALGSSKTRVDTLSTKLGYHHRNNYINDKGSTKLNSARNRSSTDGGEIDGPTTERRLRRRRKQIPDCRETPQKRTRRMIEHAEGLLGFPSRTGKSHAVEKEKEVDQVAKFSPQPTKKHPRPVSAVQDLAVDKGSPAEVQDISESASTGICITGAFSLANLRTKSDSEKFVQMLRNSVEPRKSSKQQHLRVDDKDREIRELKRELVEMKQKNWELEMTAMNLHRLLSNILACQGKRGMDQTSEAKTAKQKVNQQRSEVTTQSAQDLTTSDDCKSEGRQEISADGFMVKNEIRTTACIPHKPHHQVLDGRTAIVGTIDKEMQQQQQQKQQEIPSQASPNRDQLIPTLVQQKQPTQNVADNENRPQEQNPGFSKVTRWILPRNGLNFDPNSSCKRADEIVAVPTEGNRDHGTPKILVTETGGRKVRPHGNDDVVSTKASSSLQTCTETTNIKTQAHIRYVPITQPPPADIGPPPPSYEVALTVYPPSQPWQHLQHSSQPLHSEPQTRTSPQNRPTDHRPLSTNRPLSEPSQTTVATSIPIFAFPQNHPALSERSKLHMPGTNVSSNELPGVAHINVLPKSVPQLSNSVKSTEDLPGNGMTITEKPREMTPRKSNELKTETFANKNSRQTSTNQVSQSAANCCVKVTTAKQPEQNLKPDSLNRIRGNNFPPTSSISWSEDFNKRLSAASNVPVVKVEAAPTAPHQVVVSSRTPKEILSNENIKSSEQTTIFPSHKAQCNNIQYPVTTISRCNLKTIPNLKSDLSTPTGEDVTRCESPEFPPPTKSISKQFREYYEHRRNNLSHLLSDIGVVQDKVPSSNQEFAAEQSIHASTLDCNADLDKWEERRISAVGESMDKFTSRSDKLTQVYSGQSTTAVVNRGSTTIENTTCRGDNINNGEDRNNSGCNNRNDCIENRSGDREDSNDKAREKNGSRNNLFLSPLKLNGVDNTQTENNSHVAEKVVDSVPLQSEDGVPRGRATLASSKETVESHQKQNFIGEDEFEPEPEIKEVYSLRDASLIPQVSLSVTTFPGGVVLSWDLPQEAKREFINTYEILGRQVRVCAEDTAPVWKRMGLVTALALPMACTLTHFKPGRKYCFAVRAVGIHNQRGPLSEINNVLIGDV